MPSDAPSSIPSGSPTLTPTHVAAQDTVLSDVPSTAPSDQGGSEATVDAITLSASIDDIMDATNITVFERVCAEEFLPEYMPQVQPAEYRDIRCFVLSQSIIHSKNRDLQEENALMGFTTSSLAILMRVASRVTLPEGTDFQSIVVDTFTQYGNEFQKKLSAATVFFEEPSDPRSIDATPAGIQTTPEPQQNESFPIVIIVVAAVGGAILAIGLSVFVIRGMQVVEDDASLGNFSNAFSEGSMVYIVNKKKLNPAFSDNDSVSTGPIMPPTPMGLDNIDLVPTAVDEEALVDLEDGLSPTSTGTSYARSPSSMDDVPLSPDSDPLGLRMTVSRVTRTIQESQNRLIGILKPPSSPPKFLAELSPASDADSRPTKCSDETSELKGLHLLATKSAVPHPSSISTNSEAPRSTAFHGQTEEPITIVSLSPRRRFFGFSGIRQKYSDRSRFTSRYGDTSRFDHEPLPTQSVDVSVDPKRAAGTPNTKSYSRYEECEARSPVGRFLRKNHTPKGSSFLQMNVKSAAHTGDVLDDLSELEDQLQGRLDSKTSATAETPKQANKASSFKNFSKGLLYYDD